MSVMHSSAQAQVQAQRCHTLHLQHLKPVIAVSAWQWDYLCEDAAQSLGGTRLVSAVRKARSPLLNSAT
jgi:hypothetical protein